MSMRQLLRRARRWQEFSALVRDQRSPFDKLTTKWRLYDGSFSSAALAR
jgi:hypothetical protein